MPAGSPDAHPRPGNRIEAGLGNRFTAIAADAVGALFDALKRLFDRLQNLGVGLLQLERDVDLVVAGRLVRHVALPGVIFHGRLQRLDAAGVNDLVALSNQRVLVGLLIHRSRNSGT
jgi:hypothetical protein